MPSSEPLEDGALRGHHRSAPTDLPETRNVSIQSPLPQPLSRKRARGVNGYSETGDQMRMDSDSNTSPVIFCNTVRASQSSQDSWMRPFSSRWKLMPVTESA